jgi:hypothetical protein
MFNIRFGTSGSLTGCPEEQEQHEQTPIVKVMSKILHRNHEIIVAIYCPRLHFNEINNSWRDKCGFSLEFLRFSSVINEIHN